jgi:hypothetical protein
LILTFMIRRVAVIFCIACAFAAIGCESGPAGLPAGLDIRSVPVEPAEFVIQSPTSDLELTIDGNVIRNSNGEYLVPRHLISPFIQDAPDLGQRRKLSRLLRMSPEDVEVIAREFDAASSLSIRRPAGIRDFRIVHAEPEWLTVSGDGSILSPQEGGVPPIEPRFASGDRPPPGTEVVLIGHLPTTRARQQLPAKHLHESVHDGFTSVVLYGSISNSQPTLVGGDWGDSILFIEFESSDADTDGLSGSAALYRDSSDTSRWEFLGIYVGRTRSTTGGSDSLMMIRSIRWEIGCVEVSPTERR